MHTQLTSAMALLLDPAVDGKTKVSAFVSESLATWQGSPPMAAPAEPEWTELGLLHSEPMAFNEALTKKLASSICSSEGFNLALLMLIWKLLSC